MFDSKPIYDQLLLEESLLRTDDRNWMILNKGSTDAIVMGLSSTADEWVDLPRAKNENIPVYQRFSGGGTVLVDDNTLFATFIMNGKALPIAPFPKPILQWTTEFYRNALQLDLTLKENDYTLGDKKIGGNAQYLKKERWLHHTTFLYHYDPQKMSLLFNPKKQPLYRAGRSHDEFLTTLHPHVTKQEFCKKIEHYLDQLFDRQISPVPSSFPKHRITTQRIA